MDTLLKSISISLLLRWVFSGAFFVLSYCVASTGDHDNFEINSKNIFTYGLAFALIAGASVYGIHRSLIYPLLEWSLNAAWAVKLRQNWRTLISQNTVNNLVARWYAQSKNGKTQLYERRKGIAAWADYIHLQYASALCIMFGSWTGCFNSSGPHRIHWPLLCLTVLFFIAATISNWRSLSVEQHWRDPVMKHEHPNTGAG